MIIKGRDPVLKRLPVRVDRFEGIQKYDIDNRYPQRAKETMYRSYTVTSAVNTLSNFINGEGFADSTLNTIITSTQGTKSQTLKKLLGLISYDRAWAKGWAVHVNYNLNYTISSITHIPFEYCRLGVPDDEGCVHKIAYCTNWERDYMKEDTEREITYYDVFNPSKVAEQSAKSGIEAYQGQIFYFSPQEDQYPLCTFDSVFEQAQTQAEIAVFGLANVVNGFTAGHIFMYPGKFEDDIERQAFKTRMQQHKGAMGANSIMVIETGVSDIKGSDFLVKTEVSNNDKLYEFTLNWIEKSILQNYSMPHILVGKMPDTGMFNQQEIEDAYKYFNAQTRDIRNEISQELSYIFQFWNTPIQSDFEIAPQVYDLTTMPVAGGGAAAGAPTNSILTNMTGAQNINYKRMIREFETGKVDYKRAKLNLQSAFGFSDLEIITLLGEDPNGPTINNA